MKHGIIIAHGPLGTAFIEAAKSIIGSDEGLFPLSVTDMSIAEIEFRLKSLIDEPRAGVDGIVIMACLRGGSSWNVSAAMIKDKSDVRLVSGCNLAMVVSFLINRNTMALDPLVGTMLQDAKQGIVLFQG
jgi:mannose/fructose-specific phosphotransferase system component IIA